MFDVIYHGTAPSYITELCRRVMTRDSTLRLVGTSWRQLHAFGLPTNPMQ